MNRLAIQQRYSAMETPALLQETLNITRHLDHLCNSVELTRPAPNSIPKEQAAEDTFLSIAKAASRANRKEIVPWLWQIYEASATHAIAKAILEPRLRRLSPEDLKLVVSSLPSEP